MCTFSSLKQGGNQRTRKESINLAQHERQLDFLIQPSASLATDDTSQEQMCSNQRSSLPPDGRYDSGQGQGQKLLPELSTDIPPNFDPSFLARLSQQISDQDGDALSDLTLSPFPFFSTSGNLLSQPVNSGGKLPHHLSSTRKSLDLPVFEIGTTATSTSLHTSALFLPQTPPTQSCQCLAAVVFAVEEFETSCNTENRAELDSIIAYQKKAIKCCRSMINCTSCTSKRENFVLLVFITEKIVAVCGQIVVLYSMKNGTPGTQAASGRSSLRGYDRLLEDWDFDTSASSSSSGSLKPASTRMLSDWRELLLGDYEVSSQLEWEGGDGVVGGYEEGGW
ncbi:uncharacterized protein CDV56_107087 [Aspergillus thermomutatus]|uniref:Aflatoxin regulatory protein domain-containing protein n=1 Tax=Aspergillus thermomutatus TaxID=41047 RepID=A0A397GXV2_ASPTH|nr:uncharacterized protein CDV56_107087 [Aspergillus thermomutatus]RHZ55822.1 hypothetical protein CDV56_107087 [Aspergillus thermomutatus]